MTCEEAVRAARAAPRTTRAPKTIREQFGHPTGALGWLVGHLMAVKNGRRSRWVISLLDPRPTDRVLEVGFGPGVDCARVARLVPLGGVAAVDRSALMLRQAARRNARAIADGRVELRLASACDLPFADESFDRAFSINSVQFWEDLRAGACELKRVLRPGGLAAVAIQPRNRGATEADTARWEARLEAALREVGFVEVRLARAPTRPAPTTCALAIR